MREEGLDRLRVVQGSVNAAAVRGPDDHRHTEVTVRAIPDARSLLNDLVESREDEVGELHLGDRDQAVDGHPDADAGDQGLVQRRVEDTLLTELVEESHRGAEDTAACTDVLAEHDDPVVAAHLFLQRVVDGGDQVLLGHHTTSMSP